MRRSYRRALFGFSALCLAAGLSGVAPAAPVPVSCADQYQQCLRSYPCDPWSDPVYCQEEWRRIQRECSRQYEICKASQGLR
jgi:hypothetical protein